MELPYVALCMAIPILSAEGFYFGLRSVETDTLDELAAGIDDYDLAQRKLDAMEHSLVVRFEKAIGCSNLTKRIEDMRELYVDRFEN